MENLLTPKKLAEHLGLGLQTIYNRLSLGGDLPPAIRFGGTVRFDPSDVRAWTEARRQGVPVPSHNAPEASIKPRRGRPRRQIH